MSTMDHYFAVGAGSPLFKEVEELKNLMTIQHNKRKELMKEFCQPRDDGFEEVLMVNGHGGVIGLKIQAAPGKKGEEVRRRVIDWEERRLKRVGWRWDMKEGFNKPDLRTPEGKAIKAKMKMAPGNLDWCNISRRLFGHNMIFAGMHMWFAVLWWNKDKIIVKMGSPVLNAIDKNKLKEYKMKEITASAADKIINPTNKKDDGE